MRNRTVTVTTITQYKSKILTRWKASLFPESTVLKLENCTRSTHLNLSIACFHSSMSLLYASMYFCCSSTTHSSWQLTTAAAVHRTHTQDLTQTAMSSAWQLINSDKNIMPVSAKVGDHLWTGKPPRRETRHPDLLSLSLPRLNEYPA